MPYAIELFFEKSLDAQVRRVWADLAATAAVSDLMAQKGSRPHLALAVFEELASKAKLLESLADLAAGHAPFDVRLDSFGTFAGDAGILFFAPVPTANLLAIHRACHEHIAGQVEGMSPYYDVDKLVFHCTANMGLDPEGLSRALAAAKAAPLPLAGKIEAVGLVRFPEVDFLGDFILGQR